MTLLWMYLLIVFGIAALFLGLLLIDEVVFYIRHTRHLKSPVDLTARLPEARARLRNKRNFNGR